MEALGFTSSPFWFLSSPTSAHDVTAAVSLHWEALDVPAGGPGHAWACWPVLETGTKTLVATLSVAAEEHLPQAWAQAVSCSRFEPAALLLPLPADGLAIWRELGRLAVAFTLRGRLLHLASLTARDLDADAAFEIRDLHQALLASGCDSTIQTVKIWTSCHTDFQPQMASLFTAADFEKRDRPAPALPAFRSGLLPASVALQQQRRLAGHQKAWLLAVAALIYCSFFAAWWLRLEMRESHWLKTDASLTALQPQVESIHQARSRWLGMEAAVDPDSYPLEVFHQVVSLLPEEGIRLNEFQMSEGRLVISGEATTVNLALGFKGKLEACTSLQRYDWSFPLPRIRDEDSRAEFRAQGILPGGASHEGQ